MAGKPWTREETIIAFNLYCKIPFGKIHSTNPDVVKMATLMGRTSSSVSMKMGNLGSFDPKLMRRGVVGLKNASKLDEEVWNEFNGDWDRLTFESELLIAGLENKPIEAIQSEYIPELRLEDIPIGKEREIIVKARVNQNFFRSTILSSYNGKCCISGLAVTRLLVASHIKPWSKDKENRTNPHNGLCLNSLHDKAFDTGLITITPEYKVKVSSTIIDLVESDTLKRFFLDFDGKAITLPERFIPDPIFLEYHQQVVFQK